MPNDKNPLRGAEAGEVTPMANSVTRKAPESRPCLHCGEPVQGRTNFVCPTCQRDAKHVSGILAEVVTRLVFTGTKPLKTARRAA